SKGKHHLMAERFSKELNLSDEQLDKIKEIRKANRAQLKEHRNKFKTAKNAFREAMKDPKSGNEELKKKFEDYQSARSAFHKARFDMMLSMRSVLGPDQLEKFQTLHGKQRKGKRRK